MHDHEHVLADVGNVGAADAELGEDAPNEMAISFEDFVEICAARRGRRSLRIDSRHLGTSLPPFIGMSLTLF